MFSINLDEILAPPARIVLNFRPGDCAKIAKDTRSLLPYDLHFVDAHDICLEVALLGPQLFYSSKDILEELAQLIKSAAMTLPCARKLQFDCYSFRTVWPDQRHRYLAEFEGNKYLIDWMNKLQKGVIRLGFPGVPRTSNAGHYRRPMLSPNKLYSHISAQWGNNLPPDSEIVLGSGIDAEIVSVEIKGPGARLLTPFLRQPSPSTKA